MSKLKKFLLFIIIIFILLIIIGIVAGKESDKPYKDSIALIKIEGEIINSDNILKKIRKVEEYDKYKALILRINSPGGAVAPSQEIYRELKRLKKPKVVSISSLGASGAYYISCGADIIVAEEGSLVGSIGVIMNLPYYKELLKKIGYSTRVIKSGKLKDVGNPEREMSKQEKEYIQDLINQTYEQFLTTVAKSRNLNKDSIRQYCDGRVFNGEYAKKIGFIDTLGNYYDAVDIAKKLVHNSQVEIFEIKDKKTLSEQFFEDLNSSVKNIKPKIGTYFLFKL